MQNHNSIIENKDQQLLFSLRESHWSSSVMCLFEAALNIGRSTFRAKCCKNSWMKVSYPNSHILTIRDEHREHSSGHALCICVCVYVCGGLHAHAHVH